MKKRTLSIITAALCLVLSVWFLLPLTFGILHIGMLWPTALLLLAAARLLWPAFFRRLLRRRWLRYTVRGVIGAGLAITLTALCFMISAAANRSAPEGSTVVVLGCEVYGSGPSLILRHRIDAAYDYLSAHPRALCVASGGQNDNELISEAQCIREMLVSMGIDPARIYPEARSASTEENLAFSAQLIRSGGLCTDVVIASDNFHQLRAAIWARRNGLVPYSDGCPTVWYLAPGYWAREAAALVYMTLTGV